MIICSTCSAYTIHILATYIVPDSPRGYRKIRPRQDPVSETQAGSCSAWFRFISEVLLLVVEVRTGMRRQTLNVTQEAIARGKCQAITARD